MAHIQAENLQNVQKNTFLAKSSGVNGLRLWFEMFSRFFRNQTYRIFYSRTFPLPYIVVSEIGISFAITDLVRTNFMLNRFWYFCFIVSMEISITLKNTFNQTSILFQKLVSFSHQSDQVKVGKTAAENTRYGPEYTVSNHFSVCFVKVLFNIIVK